MAIREFNVDRLLVRCGVIKVNYNVGCTMFGGERYFILVGEIIFILLCFILVIVF